MQQMKWENMLYKIKGSYLIHKSCIDFFFFLNKVDKLTE